MDTAQNREPVLGGVLSFFFLGLGQAYNSQRQKGYMFLASVPVLMILYFLLVKLFNDPLPVKGQDINQATPSYIITAIAYLIIWIAGIYDAVVTGRKINNDEIELDTNETAGRSVLIFLRNTVLAFIGLIVLVPILVIIVAMFAR